jgi:crotonobetainyl-CoA:carnitine CoA-transferase CaiB-like acyl-CoA transferase
MRWLEASGAEIIKIEWPENERGRLPSTTTPQDVEINFNTSGIFNDTNVNKKSFSLNIRKCQRPGDRKTADGPIRHRDRELQLPRAAELGLGYQEQCKIKSDIVYMTGKSSFKLSKPFSRAWSRRRNDRAER